MAVLGQPLERAQTTGLELRVENVTLQFEGLNTPLDVTVDKDENIYVADRGNDRVVKLSGS